MKTLKHFMLNEHTNKLYKEEAVSSISLARDIANKINELVDSYNELYNWNYAKHQEQDGKIRKGVLYMKDNLINNLNDLRDTLVAEGYVFNDEKAQEYIALLDEYIVNIKPNGVYDTDMLQGSINTLKNGGIVNCSITEDLFKLNSPINISKINNLTIKNARIDCTGLSSVFNIKDGCENITFENCYFKGGNQIIRLFNCNNITVKNCTFDETGYGVIQSEGYNSNNVWIIDNLAKNMTKDFVECNCTSSAKSSNWFIRGNTYTHKEIPLTRGTEQRFVGITAVDNVVISDNIVEHVKGDAIIHLEDIGGNINIENNIFKDSMGFGYVYILHSEKAAVINGNQFINNLSANTQFIYIYNSDTQTHSDTLVSNNLFIGNGTQNYPFECSYKVLFTGNTIKDIGILLSKITMNIKYVGNVIECEKLCHIEPGVGSAKVENTVFFNNVIKGDIILKGNNTSTQFSRFVTFNGNEIEGEVSIKDCKDIIFINNVLKTKFKFSFDTASYYSERMHSYNNFMDGIGKIDGLSFSELGNM